jgi:aspartate/methionine/tyrosine aminotransferase
MDTNRFSQALAEIRAAGAPIFDLTLSNPSRAGLRFDAANILTALSSPKVMDYDPQPLGLSSARAAVIAYYSEHGVEVDPSAVLLTTSTSEAYSHVFRLLCDPGDEVLVAKPSYPLFEFLADLQDVKLRGFSLLYDHGWQIDFESLKAQISDKTRAIVVVHPNNPTGSYVSVEERNALMKICREQNLGLIVDEVFLDYGLEAGKAQTFAGSNEALTFVLSGVSKISALPQMKLAWIVTSGPQQSRTTALERLEVIADTYLSMNAPVQWAAPVLLEERRSIQPQLMSRVKANLDELDRQLESYPQCSRLAVQGGWYAVLRLPVVQSDEDLAIALLREKGVLVHPGHFYDFQRDGYLVVSLIVPAEEFRLACESLFSWFAQPELS